MVENGVAWCEVVMMAWYVMMNACWQAKREEMTKEFEPVLTWLKDEALKDKVRDSFDSCIYTHLIIHVNFID